MELVGLILPPVIDFLNARIKSSQIRWVISVVVCGIVGVALNLDKLDFSDWAKSTSVIFLSAQTAYKLYWEKSQVRETIVKKMS